MNTRELVLRGVVLASLNTPQICLNSMFVCVCVCVCVCVLLFVSGCVHMFYSLCFMLNILILYLQINNITILYYAIKYKISGMIVSLEYVFLFIECVV